MMASTVSDPTYFRYCPHCVKEDLEELGECYWHLPHLLPGVLLCLKHNCLLQNSTVFFRGRNKYSFVAATKEYCNFKDRLCNYNDKTMTRLKAIASDIIKLSQTNFDFSWLGIQRAYKYLLQKHGFATVNGTVNQRTLAEEFCWFYSEELLTALQSPVNSNNSACWLKAITRKHRKSFHPIRHLLFIHFLGEDIQSFHQYANLTYKPFGKGPYPCLNASAEHYLQPVIPDTIVTICTDTRNPVGTFKCSCGFIYSRRGPDKTPEDRYKIGRIKRFGPVWEDKLQSLIHDEKLNYYAIAKQLHVDIGTVKKYANGDKTNKVNRLTNDNPSSLFEKQALWLQLQEQYPNLSKTELRKKAPALYMWLYRHARKWLDENSPNTQRTFTVNRRVDWNQRDYELLIAVQTAVIRLYFAKKPVQINRSRIGKEIGKLALLERHLDKLPLTAAYLKQVIETREQFQIRRVKWAAGQLFKNNEDIVEWRIRRIAGLKTTIPVNVQQEIETQISIIN